MEGGLSADSLIEAQQERNKRIAHPYITPLVTPTVRYVTDIATIHLWHTTSAQHTVRRSAVAPTCVTLYISPFNGRPPTIAFTPLDRPWDGDGSSKDTNAYVVPSPLPHINPTRVSVQQRMVPRTGAYAAPRFIMPAGAVRFSAVMCTLEQAGFTEETSLLATSWSLKWCKRPVRSDFIRLKRFQRINHFPGTWHIGKKDELHRHLVAARARWNERVYTSGKNLNSDIEKNGMTSIDFGNFFPDAWVLPEEQDELHRVMSSRHERGHVFIVKPTTSACGRGIYLVKAKEHPTLNLKLNPSDVNSHENNSNNNNNINGSKKGWCVDKSVVRPGRVIVQRYVTDPLLIEGYKFDLRLYLVVTSFFPLRAYLYDEGLVRFATSPYPTANIAGSSMPTGAECALTAHLTNFTINKMSEDYVAPGKTHNGGEVEITASKWTLTTLAKYFRAHALDWEGTMTRIHDVLLKVLLAVEPRVMEEFDALSDAHRDVNLSLLTGTSTPAYFSASSSCFEVYGVDILLRQPQAPLEMTPIPVLMEVNIMPSLSTHYSILDQCVKGNLIADMLTLVGITAMGMRRRGDDDPVKVSEGQKKDSSLVSYGHPFLDSLTDINELDACLTSEEEFLRSTHFCRLCPTPQSYAQYRVLFTEGNVNRQGRSLNEVLSLWEQAKIDNPPPWV